MPLANAQKLVRSLIGFVIIAIILYWSVLFIVRTFGMLTLPFQAEYGEGPVLDWARQIANGTLPYKPIDIFPYNFSVYTPAYLAASAIFIHLVPANPWLGGRLLSLISALGLVWLIYNAGKHPGRVTFLGDPNPAERTEGSLRKVTLPGIFPTLAVILWLVSPYVFRWATFYRPDMAALFWSGLGMLLIFRKAVVSLPRTEAVQDTTNVERSYSLPPKVGGKGWGWGASRPDARSAPTPTPPTSGEGLRRTLWGGERSEILAALCFVLSFYTKQSFFAAPLAAVLYLTLTNRRAAIRLVVAGAVLGGTVALGLWASVGRSIVDNLIAANANPFSWEALQRFWWSFLTTVPLLIVLAIVSARRRENWLWGLYLLLAVLVSISIGKAGAWENYFLEPLWVMCVLVARGNLGMVGNGRPQGSSLQVGFAVLVLVQLLLYTRGYERLSIPAEITWLNEVRAEGQALHDVVAALPPDTIVYSEQMGVLAELNRPVPLHSFVYTQLARQGLWDDAVLTTRLAAGEGVVIQAYDAINDSLKRDRWNTPMLDAIEAGYNTGEQVGEWLVRTPAPLLEDESITPRPLDNGFTLEAWQATVCGVRQDCTLGAPPIALVPNGTLTVSTLWRSAEAINTPLSISLKLFDPSGQLVDQKDGPLRNGWMGRGWAANVLVRDVPRELTLPATLPSGVYTLDLTLYESDSTTPRATTRLPFFKVAPEASSLPSGSIPSDTTFGGRITLLEYSPLPAALQAGDTLTLDTRWRGEQWSELPITTFLHIVAPDGTIAAQTDFVPAYPPTVWSNGEQVAIPYTVQLPADAPVGTYQLLVGWYASDTFTRLPIDATHDALSVATLQITAP